VAGHRELLCRRTGGRPALDPAAPPELLAEGAGAALAFPLGYATIGLVLTLRRPVNPIGWLYSASGLV
jgi:hypothetical protein